jgi:hypothetical protein
MIEAVRISETSAYSNETTMRYIPGGSNLHALSRENLKSHIPYLSFLWGMFYKYVNDSGDER